MKKLYWFLHQLFLAFDQLCNVMLLGWADETLSSRSYRSWRNGHRYFGWIMHVIDFIFFWQDEHCKLAYWAEKKRLQSHPETRSAD